MSTERIAPEGMQMVRGVPKNLPKALLEIRHFLGNKGDRARAQTCEDAEEFIAKNGVVQPTPKKADGTF